MFSDLFIYDKTDRNVEYYKTNSDKYCILIEAIDIETGNIKLQPISQYTYHSGLKMYSIKDKQNRFEQFYASSDHSLIVYEVETNTYKKISPLSVMKFPEKYHLVQQTRKGVRLIPCVDLEISQSTDITDAGDFTVDNYFTFCTSDGVFVQDTQAIYTPLLQESIDEFKTKLMNSKNQISPGTLHFESISQYGYSAYVMTKDDPDKENVKLTVENNISIEELERLLEEEKLWYFDTVYIKQLNIYTTVGRILLGLYFKDISLFHKTVNKKDVDQLVTNYIHTIIETEARNIEYEDLEFLDDLLQKHFINIPINISIRDFTDAYTDPKFIELKKNLQEAKGSQVEITLQELENYISEYVKDKNIGLFINSKAKGTLENIRQILSHIGTVTSVTKRSIPIMIKRSFAEGLSPKDYAIMSFSTRKGSMDRSVNTATTGYLARRLAFAMVEQVLGEDEDCGVTKYLEVKLTEENWEAYNFRYFVNTDGNLIQLTKSNKDKFIGKQINIRTPLFCKCKTGICKICYPYDIFFDSRYIGIIGSQAISERGTQLIMRTFHTGSIAKNIRDFIDREKFDIIDQNIISKHTFEIQEIDSVDLEMNYHSLSAQNVLKNNLYLISENTEYLIPKGAILVINVSKGITIHEGDVVAEIPDTQVSDLTSVLDNVIKVLDKPEEHSWQSIYDLLMKSFYFSEGILSIHFELLLGNMMRDPMNINEQYRLTDFTKEPVLMGIKQIPKLRPILAIGFQEFQQALLSYLVNGSQTDLTIYEKIITGINKESLTSNRSTKE